MVTSLLSTKYRIPPASTHWIERPYLLKKLDKGLSDGKPLLLVCAPAGYGKTTLVNGWVQRITSTSSTEPLKAQTRAAWLTCEQEDSDLARFLSYLVAAIQQVDPPVGSGMIATFHASRLPPPVTLATLLINDLMRIQNRLVLVLDDFHTIASQPVQEFLTFLIEHQPPQICLVLVTRADPAMPLAKYRGRGQLEEIRQSDLAFSLEESADFLSHVMNVTLTWEQMCTLEKRTEGWATGLQLAALSLREASLSAGKERDVPAFIQAFSGGHEYIAEYLAGEVLAQQPDPLKSFLLQTSILERLSAPLCEAVTGDAQAAENLETLREKNLFLIPLDHEKTWYRYHTLFAHLLRSRLHRMQGSHVQELHLRASRWYQENGFFIPAIEHAFAGQDPGQAAALIERSVEQLFIDGHRLILIHWLETLQDDTKNQHPILWIFLELANLWGGKATPASSTGMSNLLPIFQAAGLVGEASTLQALYAMTGGNPQEAARLAEDALQQLSPGRALFHCLAADTVGMARIMQGDSEKAMRAFEYLVDTAARAGYVMFEIIARSHLAGLCLQQGRLHAARMGYHRALALADERIGRFSPLTGNILLGLGEIAREWGDYDGALDYFLKSVEMFSQFSEIGIPIAYLSIARMKLARQEWKSAQEFLEKARQCAQSSSVTRLNDRLVDAMQARYWIACGELGLAEQWAREKGLVDLSLSASLEAAGKSAAGSEFFQNEYLTLARLYLAQNNPDAALNILDQLADAARSLGTTRRLIPVLVLKALVLQKKKAVDSAVEILGQALMLAEPEEYRQVFMDESNLLSPLLYQAVRQGYAPTYAKKILAALAQESPRSTGPGQNPLVRRLLEPLSQRELEVLELVAGGLSNREICARLHISLSTVKGHTASIYGKLGVNSRTQAVAEATRLGILTP